MAKKALALEHSPELSLEEIEEIKIPIDLFESISLKFCRENRILPLRLDESTKTFSFLFVDPDHAPRFESCPALKTVENYTPYRISEEILEQLILQFDEALEDLSFGESQDPRMGWTIALIEPDDKQAEALSTLLQLQKYEFLRFPTESEFRETLQSLAERLDEDEDLVNLAESQDLVPFQAVIVRKSVLEKPGTFSDFVWAHFNHLRVSILSDRWLHPLLDQAMLQGSRSDEDFSFHLRHGNYYYAAIECLKKGNIFQGVELLEQVTLQDAHYIKAKVLLGKAFLKKRNYNKAAAHFQKAYDHWCEDPEGLVDDNIIKLLYHLAYTFEKLGRLDDALKLYERVAAEDPLFREVSARLAKVKDKRARAIKAGEKKLGLPAFSKANDKEKNRYEKLDEIGKGGMGIVYRARDKVLGREVAMKVLNSHFKHDEKIVETFLREAKSLAALNHLNIVTIFDAGIEDGNYYIAMEFIEGRTVRELLKKKGFFRVSTSLALARQVLKALAYAHSKRVIHRDITTNNMMLTETKVVKLMDFGLARVVNQLHSEQSIIGGTPYFMSPEQVEGAPIDHRTDIYSFGVCLFEMLTGQVPFPMENPGYHHLHTTPPDPQTLKKDLPRTLCDLILTCLEKNPKDRFQSADELLSALRPFSESDESSEKSRRSSRLKGRAKH